MSQYAQFFIKNGNTYLPIGTYSRSTTIFDSFGSYLPAYKAPKALNSIIIHTVRNDIRDEIDAMNKLIAEDEKLLDRVKYFENSVDEKIVAIQDYNTMIEERKQIIKELERADSFAFFLGEIIEDGKTEGFDEYVFAGIEVEEFSE